MDSVKEKTTALYPPVGPGGGQSLSQSDTQSIAEEVDEHKPQEEDLLEKMRRFSDPAYLHTVSMNDLYENVYQSKPPVIDGLLCRDIPLCGRSQGGQVLSHGPACLSCEYGPFPVGV